MKYILSLLLSLTTVLSLAQGNKLELNELGLSFTIPEGWSYTAQEDLLVMGHTSIPGLMLLFENQTTSVQELKQTALEGLHEPTVDLNPSGDFTIKGNNWVEGYYTGVMEGTPVKCFAIGLINGKGRGLTILSLTEQSAFSNDHVSEAKKLMNSVEFYKEKDTPSTADWRSRLTGRQLKYLSTYSSNDYGGGYSGTSDRTEIRMYANGQFDYYSSSNASFDGSGGFGYANDSEANEGTYRIYSMGTETFLELKFNNGAYLTYTLERNSEGQTLLNGTRYFLVGLEE